MTLDLVHFTPLASLCGGVLIGGAAALLILGAGRILGASGVYAGAVQTPAEVWRWWWLVGLVAAPLIAKLVGNVPAPVFTVGPLTLAAAGLLVGFGARLGSGCTSGHGVCGIARLSPRSLAATAIFMTSGFLVVFAVRHLAN
jgi:uncharacterized membrane protein YedE/YeeE